MSYNPVSRRRRSGPTPVFSEAGPSGSTQVDRPGPSSGRPSVPGSKAREVPSSGLSAVQKGKRRAIKETSSSLTGRRRANVPGPQAVLRPPSQPDAVPTLIDRVGHLRPAPATTALASADSLGSWEELKASPAEARLVKEHLDLAREVYEAIRWFHGTSVEGQASIREHGFDRDRKTDGALSAMDRQTGGMVSDDEILAATSRHYLARNKETGKYFATLAAPGDPALVRTLVPDEDALRLKPDPAIPRNGQPNPDVKRTRRSIPREHVAQSKRAPPGVEGPVFQEALRQCGADVSERVAALLLREVQSSSEHDFSETDDSDIYNF